MNLRARRSARPRRSVLRLVALAAALAVAGSRRPPPRHAAPADDGRLSVLLFYKPNFHASNVQARQAVRDLATQLGTQYGQPVDIQETEDPAAFNTANLAIRDTVVFAQTGGVLFNAAQRAALEAYIRGGGGFMGLHYTGWSVGESEHDVNPFYARLVGAVSEGHPENPGVRPGRVFVKNTSHPLTQGVPASITRSDEWYDWVVNPAPWVRTLIEADETSYGMGRQGSMHPVTWCQTIDSGRSWYTSMGHEGTAYSESYMLAQMKNGLAYAAKLLAADCSPPVEGPGRRLERRHAVAAGPDQHGTDLRRHGCSPSAASAAGGTTPRRMTGPATTRSRRAARWRSTSGTPPSHAPWRTSATASCRTPRTPTCSAPCRCRARTTTPP